MISGSTSGEGLQVPMIVHTFVKSPVFFEAGSEKERRLLHFPDEREDRALITNPNRGIVLATFLSSFFWAALILAARGIWLLMRLL
jgi:hypothetical protein